MANQPVGGHQEHRVPNIVNNYNITTPEKLTESEIKRQIDLVSRELGYRMGL